MTGPIKRDDALDARRKAMIVLGLRGADGSALPNSKLDREALLLRMEMMAEKHKDAEAANRAANEKLLELLATARKAKRLANARADTLAAMMKDMLDRFKEEGK